MAKSAKIPKAKRPRTGKRGAPQQYDRKKLVPAICARLANGEPHAVILRDLGLKLRTVNQWRQDDPEIAAQFDEARDLGFDAIAAECMVIADDGRRDYVLSKDGVVVDHDHIARSKLRIETRLKLLAKWDPRRYGEKVQHSNDPDNPLPAPQFVIQPVRPASGGAGAQVPTAETDE